MRSCRWFLVLLLAGCAQESESARPPLSEAIKVDQVGYLPARAKLAIVTDPRATGSFSVRRSTDGGEVLTGRLGPPLPDPDTGDTVRTADFSVVNQTGTFYLDVAGVGASHEFDVAPDVYAKVFYVAMRAFYGQRCGAPVDLAPTYPGYRHAACHAPGTPNPDALMHASSGAAGSAEATGGWHDAGDYGKYVVNSGITTGELLWTFEVFANRVGPVRLDIPESGNSVPDLLDEVRWNLDWMLKMQDGDGGVWHKLTSERFGGFVMPERDDGGPRYVIGTGAPPYKSSCATGDFAAVMATAARLFRPFDSDFAAATLAASERAWRWLSVHPTVVFKNCCGVQTGEYGDASCADERLWAAAELFRTTGGAEYNGYFAANHAAARPGLIGGGTPSWQDVGTLALLTYSFSAQPATDEAVR
ncbi:MAG TPA: glycoside hydrolase family 9 protein, partial [Vicinamibacteria bacterium]